MPRVNKNEADSIESHEQTLRHDEPSCLGRVSMKVFNVCVYLENCSRVTSTSLAASLRELIHSQIT